VAYHAPMKYGLLLLLLVGTMLQAQVYKSVDANGNVIFTDVPDDNAEEVIIDIAPSYTAPEILPPITAEELSPEAEPQFEELAIPRYRVSISSPAQNEAIHNPESVTVTAKVSPTLNVLRADKLVFKLDGKAIGTPQTGTESILTGLERGSHILLVSVVDKNGKVIKSSKSVLFHIHRRSVAR